MPLEAEKQLAYLETMRIVEEIKEQISKLKPAEVRQVAKWLAGYEAELWDKQIKDDAGVGKLDRYIKEALEERHQGKSRPLP